jgi:hypothetical protein
VRQPDDLGRRVDGPEGVRHVAERDDAGAVAEQLLVHVHPQFAGIRHRHDAQHRAGRLARHLPRHEVGVVLENRHHDLVAGAEQRAGIGLRDQVDRLGRAADEDDLARLASVQEGPDELAGAFVVGGRALAEQMDTPVNVGVVVQVVVRDGVDDRPRLLRRRRVVQIHERLPVDRLVQDRKVPADGGGVEGDHANALSASAPGNRAASRRSSSARTGSRPIRPVTSVANALISRLRASSRPMPRARR